MVASLNGWLTDTKMGLRSLQRFFLNTPSNEIDLREYPYGLVTNDVVIVAHQPAGGAEALINPFVWIPATIDYIKSLAPIEPSFDAPENFDTGTAGSPNNKINGQTNTIRLYEKNPAGLRHVQKLPRHHNSLVWDMG